MYENIQTYIAYLVS